MKKRMSFSRIIKQQERYVERVRAQPHPCPECGVPLSWEEADQLDGDLHRCPRCAGKIRVLVPAFDPLRSWCWIKQEQDQ